MESDETLGGRYRLVELLGEGGMSAVWRAHDEVLRRPVAVKVLSSRHLTDDGFRERIRAEALAAAGLSHPHIASVYDFGESLGTRRERVPYVVMELLDGRSLADVVSDGPLTPRQAMRICAEVASALAAAHARGIVHRDVKPGNVMVTPNGAKVVDFGIAAAAGELADFESAAIMYGTPAYLAPERLEDGPAVTATDVYALGLLLYRLLTGQLPWSAETTTQILRAHVYVEPKSLPRQTGLPIAVTTLYQRCLEKDPANRPTAAEAARILADAAGISVSLPGSPSFKNGDTSDFPTVPRVSPARRRARFAGAAVAAVALVAAVVVGATQLAGAGAEDRSGDRGLPANKQAAQDANAGLGATGGSTGPGTPPGGTSGAPPTSGNGAQPIPGSTVVPSNGSTTGSSPVGGGSPSGPGGAATNSQVVEFETKAGHVSVRCSGTTAVYVTHSTFEGYSSKVPAAAPNVVVRYRSDTLTPMKVKITISCATGKPDPDIRESNNPSDDV
ncbi:serine/threonine-protein kinase [Virgisporangium aliadipatigenens]|uniref:serine/threonine-protein kinase n=1 Tax=Virgisporangium aliadipatigenens TaxID=741659 RepID=UPI001EF2C6F3|nr:serine/threonine-protein kinase [Virgisporangium aliadipatigenens]